MLYESYLGGYQVNNFRNKLARKMVNFVMNHIATKEYSEAMSAIIHRGMLSNGQNFVQMNGKK